MRATAHSFTTLLLAVGIFGVGGPLISSGVPKLASQWFSGRGRSRGLPAESIADNGLDQVLLRAEVAKEGDLVDARLAGDGACRRAVESVAREYPRGGANQKLAGRGVPAAWGLGVHASSYLHSHPGGGIIKFDFADRLPTVDHDAPSNPSAQTTIAPVREPSRTSGAPTRGNLEIGTTD